MKFFLRGLGFRVMKEFRVSGLASGLQCCRRHAHVYRCMYICTCMCTCVYLYTCTWMYKCVYEHSGLWN